MFCSELSTLAVFLNMGIDQIKGMLALYQIQLQDLDTLTGSTNPKLW